MNPQEPTGKYVNGGRSSKKDYENCDQEIDTAPEPTVPLSMRTMQCYGLSGPGWLSLLRFDEYLPSTEVQDFGNKTSKKHSGWDWPPICINPDAHCSASIYQQLVLRQIHTEQPQDHAGDHSVIPPVAHHLGDKLMPGQPTTQ